MGFGEFSSPRTPLSSIAVECFPGDFPCAVFRLSVSGGELVRSRTLNGLYFSSSPDCSYDSKWLDDLLFFSCLDSISEPRIV